MFVLKKSAREFETQLAKKGLLQSELATKLKVQRAQISNLKNHSSKGSLGEIKLIKLCSLLDIKFNDWFEKKKPDKNTVDKTV